MRVFHIKLFFIVELALLASLIAGCLYVLKMPAFDAHDRPVQTWKPVEKSNTANADVNLPPFVLNEALSRPLFRADRKPFAPVAIVAQPVPQQPVQPPPPPQLVDTSKLVLKGLAINDGVKRALIISGEKPDGDWYKIGGQIDGWKLVGLNANTATLTINDQKITLSLYVDNPANSVATP